MVVHMAWMIMQGELLSRLPMEGDISILVEDLAIMVKHIRGQTLV